MTSPVDPSRPPTAASEAPGGFRQSGCELNALSTEELFYRYRRSRFLYPAKQRWLAPYGAEILDTWDRTRRAGSFLHRVVTFDAPDGGWSSLTMWRSTQRGWHTQHLVSSGSPGAARVVMLATQAETTYEGRIAACQNWFQPRNPFAARAFGGMTARIGTESAAVVPGRFYMVPLAACASLARTPEVEELDGGFSLELARLATKTRGWVYLCAEELDRDDLRLTEVDHLYRLVGLRRYRRLWAQRVSGGRMRAAAIAQRGPIGLNFSFLENRCDLLVDPAAKPGEARRAVRALLAAAGAEYRSFPPQAVPVVCSAQVAPWLQELGATLVAPYSQAMWLAAAYDDWYRHIEETYARRAGTNVGSGPAPERER
ncbi:hypothetical protein [Streptomyces sp. NPDC046939]|uniref:hypothetical protein n=1 Tax=Streptomyces sp. NPDC046939 TaxID=3155376 RepID=UPI0033CF29A7